MFGIEPVGMARPAHVPLVEPRSVASGSPGGGILNRFLKPAVRLALALALAGVCASWLWTVAGPRGIARGTAGEAATMPVDLAAAGRLFGTAAAASAAAPVNPLADVLLKGVYRSREGEGGFVVVQIGNQAPRPVMVGAEIRPGIKLAKLGTDHGVFEDERGEIRLDLPVRPALIKPAVH